MEETDKREGNVIGVSLKSKKKKKKSKTAEKKDETSKKKVNLNYKRILSFLTAI